MISALWMYSPSNRFNLSHCCRRTHIRQHHTCFFRTLGSEACCYSVQEGAIKSFSGLAMSGCPNLMHAFLCTYVKLVTSVKHTKGNSILPFWFNSRNTFRDPRKNLFRKLWQPLRICAPCASHTLSCHRGLFCTCSPLPQSISQTTTGVDVHL